MTDASLLSTRSLNRALLERQMLLRRRKLSAIEAMLAAARRGVEISLIFESPGASHGKTAFAGLDALGDELKALSHVYVWPLDRRPKDRAGRYGSLHAKFAVADEAALFVSSANLTEYAFNFNMELGLLVRGGDLPALVAEQLRRLIEEAVLVPTHSVEK